MKRGIASLAFAFLALISVMFLSSCTKRENAEAPKPSEEAAKPAAETAAAGGPHATVLLKNGGKVPGAIVASTQTDMVVAGDDGIEHKIPLAQVKSVEYGNTQTASAAAPPSREPAPPSRKPREEPRREPASPSQESRPATETLTPAPAPIREVTTRTYELPAGSEISVRTNEAINSDSAAEGQTFDADVTRDAKDANGDIVIPRGSRARVVIKSASKGGRFRGASDLILDLQSVSINGKQYTIDTTDMTKKGKSGVGANKRTATYTGGGAALGAIIGAIAGGGKGAAIGAASGAGAGALTQIITKGGAIKVPVESVLTFNLDKSLKVTAAAE